MKRPFMVAVSSLDSEEPLISFEVCRCCLPRMINSILPRDEALETFVELAEALDALAIGPQSGTEVPFSIGTGNNNMVQQTAGFTDQNPAYTYTVDSMPDSSFGVADTGNQRLEDFMSRPLRIAEYDWATTDAAFFQTFNPWSLMFNDPRVVNRIANFNLLRCKLHVKFLINGNGFHYGRLIASYLPLHNKDTFTVDRGFFRSDIVAASQQPHVYLDPTTSQGGDMVLPFVWYKNALSIPEAEWDDMGEITVRAINDLKHANGATDSVTISVWAWAEDVSLSIPTSENPSTIQPQSGYEIRPQSGDEYGKGPISRPASILARAAGALVTAPVIGMYARATEMAASAVSAIATSFGYSRPAVLDDIVPYKPTYMGNLANTNVPDSVQKLSVDAKQETTIDPRVAGLASTDEMTIKGIGMRESYITTFPWTVDSSPNFFLWNSLVTPMLWRESVNGANTEIHMPACAFAVHPFKSWRGSMKFRFQIVASNFHKGRLRIVYDPRTAGNDDFNTAFQQIVDIAEEKDVTITVGWGNQQTYSNRANPGTDAIPFRDNAGGGALNPSPYDVHNGLLFVEVLNALTVPNSTINNDVSVNVFVSMCEDFEVANPANSYIDDYSWFPAPAAAITAQSGIEMTMADQDNTTEPSRPVSDNSVRKLAADISPTDRLADVCYGEKITSFRQLVKRYCFHTLYSNVASGGARQAHVYTRTSGDFPYYRGYAGPSAIHFSPFGPPYNYARMTLMNYITPAYVVRRGGIRYKTQQLRRRGAADTLVTFHSVTRAPLASEYNENSERFFFGNADTTEAASQVRKFVHGFAGTTIQPPANNPVLEYDLPYQNTDRFLPAKQVDQTTDVSNNTYHTYQAVTSLDSGDNLKPFFFDYVAGAEDFSLSFFTGCPIMYYAPSDPT